MQCQKLKTYMETGRVVFLPAASIRPNPAQPRKVFRTDALDELGWEPRPGMVTPLFTCEEEAVKRDCPLGAFPSASAPALFAHFAETGLDLELDPFGAHPVKISAAAVCEISQILGGSPGKFRWIRRTLPW